MQLEAVSGESITAAVISCVVPGLLRALTEAVRGVLDLEPIVVSVDLDLPVTVKIGNPRELGSDLLANAVAGYLSAEGAAIVVDFGTALTFTAVNASGHILGASIAPGVSTGLHGLVSRTAALPGVDLTPPPPPFIGTDTSTALRAGLLRGYTGLVDGMVAGISREIVESAGGEATVIATGGEATLVAEQCESVSRIEPWLTLQGLEQIGKRNSPARQST
jgi:type III pantothenate kinase